MERWWLSGKKHGVRRADVAEPPPADPGTHIYDEVLHGKRASQKRHVISKFVFVLLGPRSPTETQAACQRFPRGAVFSAARTVGGGSDLEEDVRDVLLGAGLFSVAQLWSVFAGQEALVSHQSHALVRHLVPFKMHLVIRSA